MSDYTLSTGDTIHMTDNLVPGANHSIMMNQYTQLGRMTSYTQLGRMTSSFGTVGFQPAPFAKWALTPEALRALADMIEDCAA